MENNELYHDGIKGMRWGIRRYQNKDGSLTPAGRKRYKKEVERLKAERKTIQNQKRTNAKLQKLEDMRKENEELRNKSSSSKTDTKKADKPETSGKKKLSEMTNEEIADAITRKRLENSYRKEFPEQVSRGQKLVSTMLNDVVKPVATDVAKKALTKMVDDKLKVKDPNSLEALKKTHDVLDMKRKIEKLKKNDPDSDLSWDDRIKKQTYEKNKKEAEDKAKNSESDDWARKAKMEEDKNKYYSKKEANEKYESDKKAAEEAVDKVKDKVYSELRTKDGELIVRGEEFVWSLLDDENRWDLDHSDSDTDELYHDGIKGMRWGIRRYQNKDGSLTPAGRKRYSKEIKSSLSNKEKKLLRDGAEPFPYSDKKTGLPTNQVRNKNKVADKFSQDIMNDIKNKQESYSDYVKKNPKFEKDMESKGYEPYEYWSAKVKDKTIERDIKKSYKDRFIDEYSNAMLSDLEMTITPEAKKYAEECIRKAKTYETIFGVGE